MANQTPAKATAPVRIDQADRTELADKPAEENLDQKVDRLRKENEVLKLEIDNAKLRMGLRSVKQQLDANTDN